MSSKPKEAINTTNQKWENDLCEMVRKNRPKCVLSLLINGADVNKPDAIGDYPLHIAVMNGDIHLFKCLIIFDANVNLKNGKGMSARHLAATENLPNHPEILTLLISIGAQSCVPNTV